MALQQAVATAEAEKTELQRQVSDAAVSVRVAAEAAAAEAAAERQRLAAEHITTLQKYATLQLELWTRRHLRAHCR